MIRRMFIQRLVSLGPVAWLASRCGIPGSYVSGSQPAPQSSGLVIFFPYSNWDGSMETLGNPRMFPGRTALLSHEAIAARTPLTLPHWDSHGHEFQVSETHYAALADHQPVIIETTYRLSHNHKAVIHPQHRQD